MVKDKLEVYKCNVCGNIVEVLEVGGGELVCCNQSMEKLEEKTQDEGLEKHVPVIEKDGDKVIVRVGSVSHPMEDKHYIQWVELISGDLYCRQFLKPGQEPQAEFKDLGGDIKAREYCNLHGLWKS